jgi:hypothetical protein
LARFSPGGGPFKTTLAFAPTFSRRRQFDLARARATLAAYCHLLRTRYGLAIRTEREEHPGGWHGRHVLETPVRIVLVADPEQEAEAA